MKSPLIVVLLFLVSCTSAPIKTSGQIVKERDAVLNEALPKLKQCITTNEKEGSVALSFKLYDDQSSVLIRPKKIAYNPKTNLDEIDVILSPDSKNALVKIDCVRAELRKLSFGTVNPSYNYMIHHRYVMNLK